MGRIRYIKPDFFKDEDLTLLPPFARLLFAGLFTLADRDGRLEDKPRTIKAELFPFDPIDIDELLDLLAAPKASGRHFLHRYEVEGRRYIQVVNLSRHQKFHKDEKSRSYPPAPLSHPPGTLPAPLSHPPGTLPAPSQTAGCLENGDLENGDLENGDLENGELKPRAPGARGPVEFSEADRLQDGASSGGLSGPLGGPEAPGAPVREGDVDLLKEPLWLKEAKERLLSCVNEP